VSYFEPALPFLLFLGFWDLIRKWRKSSKGNRPWLQFVSMLGLLLLSLNVTAWLLARPLEIWYDQDPQPHANADAIVVLAGYVRSPSPNTPYAFAGKDTYLRLQRAIWLFKHWKPLPILACGGSSEGDVYGKTMRHVLESEGVPPDLIWIESRSRSTRENALFGADILRMHGVSRIALVVEANSMARAAASFRKLGIDVVATPAAYTHLTHELNDLLPSWKAIEANGSTVHELVGLVWYKLRGWI
jgi:uncharacterized SAM-binding protein YcdF (DUF218 family)